MDSTAPPSASAPGYERHVLSCSGCGGKVIFQTVRYPDGHYEPPIDTAEMWFIGIHRGHGMVVDRVEAWT